MKEVPAAATARQALIVRWLADEGRLDVLSLAGRLGVAQETVRRDLRTLETDGRLQRVHGGAVPVDTDPFPALVPPPVPDPDHFALAGELWARLPRTGTVLLGAGPLTSTLVSVLASSVLQDSGWGKAAPEGAGLTIVTNALDAAIAAARIPHVAVYNIGGAVSPATRAQEGDWALQELQRLQVDVSVVCPAGISLDHGLGQSSPAAAAVSRAEVACGQNVIAVADAYTLERPAFVQFASWREIDSIMLAGRPADSALAPYLERGIDIDIIEAEADFLAEELA